MDPLLLKEKVVSVCDFAMSEYAVMIVADGYSQRKFFPSMSVAQFVTSQINSSKVVIFSKSYCPYCMRAKKLFQTLKQDASVIELDQVANGNEIQDYLYSITKQRTVPNIFIGQKHIGGCDDVHSLHNSGKLTPLLQ
jgi:glutaredoxin 3